MNVQALAKHNDDHRYLLTVIDVFTEYLHIVPLKSKTAKAVSGAFESVLNDDKYMKRLKRRPVRLRTDKGKEFLVSSFQKLLKWEGIQFFGLQEPRREMCIYWTWTIGRFGPNCTSILLSKIAIDI